MSKVKENGGKDATIVATKDKQAALDPKEVIETLRTQLQEHLRLAEHHKTMANKEQGALEVLLQLHPNEELNEI